MRLHHAFRAGLVVTAMFVLSGCAADQPAAIPTPSRSESPAATTPTPTPTPEPDTAVSAIELSGVGISTVNAAGEPLTTVLFEQDAALGVAMLTEAFGEPPAESYSDGCRIGSYYSWGLDIPDSPNNLGLNLHVPEGGGPFSVRLDAPDALGVDLVISTGHHVGDDVSSIVANPAVVGGDGLESFFMWDVVSERDVNGQHWLYGGAGWLDESGTVMQAATASGSWLAFFC